ncbi:hypothetical protein FE257_003347 [Aspergillus nanangensis]|uniref:Zn(2)-C6 fungal-type domain-containing protein n=1 Tax=Aspergillus nanangensis TaxID=2582783 RepID=A0AAD4CSV7_ASPNN|nr:hypothetical protein FE257_003347 [Aspergillus nanangensis]
MSSGKPRTKTFTGCWTCRKRHVKCDEQRPECLRCRRSGRLCQGYSVRLEWTNANDSRISQQRRQLRSSIRTAPELSADAVTALLAELDHCPSTTAAQRRGPFSVFAVSFAGVTDQPPVGEKLPDVAESRESRREKSTSVFSRPSSVVAEEEEERTDLLESIIIDSHPLPDITSILNEVTPITPPPSMLNPTPINSPEIELVHHWVVFLSGQMLLIDTADNPCRTVFMPLALQGLHASPKQANMHRAVFHAICAASAFSLYHLNGEPRFQSLAVRHDQQALRHLRETLHLGRRWDEATLAAVLSCITAEAMSGRRGRWRAHVLGGLGLLEHEIQGGWVQTPTASRLLQSYISLSSLCNLRLSTRLVALLNGPPEIRRYLERSHGITASLVQFLARISALRDSAHAMTPADLDSLELQLYLQFPSAAASMAEDSGEAMVIQHALNSFYYATVIYFRRSLRHASPTQVQDLVEKAVQDLEAAEALTHYKGGSAYNWASFVVAAECERPYLQARMVTLFDSKRRHGIRNIQVLWEIVQTVWQRRASVGPAVDVRWEDIASEADFDIMLV